MARAQSPDSADSQFFIVFDDASFLDRKYTVWGRVISGLDVVRKIKAGEPVPQPQDKMVQVRLLADIPEKERPKVQVLDTRSAYFRQLVEAAKHAKGDGFSVCDVDLPAQVK